MTPTTLEAVAADYPYKEFVLNHGTPVSMDSPPCRAFYRDGELAVEVFAGRKWVETGGATKKLIADRIRNNCLKWN